MKCTICAALQAKIIMCNKVRSCAVKYRLCLV